jgi:ABC-type nickel/cobalt efflux system permease component RcnA
MEIIVWYGILHAFGPDHLSAIADFSIGKSRKKTFAITTAFAIGHGVMLFLFAKILEMWNISEELLGYGDMISSLVILFMGIYLLFMVFTKRVLLSKHSHNGKEHIHISFGKHNHKENISAFSIGALMGIGGVRGMLVTLGVIESSSVDLYLLFAFVFGVSLVFLSFGFVINFINEKLLHSQKSVERVFGTVGLVSVAVGTSMILG